jgi:hypothetical protein
VAVEADFLVVSLVGSFSDEGMLEQQQMKRKGFLEKKKKES